MTTTKYINIVLLLAMAVLLLLVLVHRPSDNDIPSNVRFEVSDESIEQGSALSSSDLLRAYSSGAIR